MKLAILKTSLLVLSTAIMFGLNGCGSDNDSSNTISKPPVVDPAPPVVDPVPPVVDPVPPVVKPSECCETCPVKCPPPAVKPPVVKPPVTPASTPPTITLNPYKCTDINYTISTYDANGYVEAGATAQDDLDGDISSQITITGAPSTPLTAGDYMVIYSVTDTSGNTVTASRKMHVVQPKYKMTGQTGSFDNAGGSYTDDCSHKDDGFYKFGIPISYTRDDVKEVVTDNATGLIWQDDKEAGEAHFRYSDNARPETIFVHCKNLDLNGITGWRVPAIQELLTIADKTKYMDFNTQQGDWAIDKTFQNIASPKNKNFYWSSTLKDNDKNYAWEVMFYDGRDTNYFGIGQGDLPLRCVTGPALTLNETAYTRDASTGIVTDDVSGLQWSDDDARKTKLTNWQESIDYCEASTLGGFDDWRLPNLNEFYTISVKSKAEPAFPAGFVNLQYTGHHNEMYWTSSTYKAMASTAWTWSWYGGADTFAGKVKGNYPPGHSSGTEFTAPKNFMCVRNK